MNRLILPVLALLTAVFPVSADEAVKIAVMDVKARQGVDNMVALSLTDLVCTEISEFGGYQVIGRDDMQAMLEHVSDQQLLECDDTKCLAKVGGALGVEQLLAGNIGMIGTTYLINFKLIDIDNAEVLNRVSQEFAGDESGLIRFVRQSVGALFGKDGGAAVTAVPNAPPVMLTDAESVPERKEAKNPEHGDSKVLKIFRYSLFGAAVLTATAAYFTYAGAEQLYKDEYSAEDQTNTMFLAETRNDIERKDLIANVLFGVSGACLVGGGVSFAF